jgi:hypothetical protein
MEKPEGEIFIIPARLEECDNLESLGKWQWVDLFEMTAMRCSCVLYELGQYHLKKAGKRPEGLSFDPIFRGNLTALARGASVGAARIIPEIFRRYRLYTLIPQIIA